MWTWRSPPAATNPWWRYSAPAGWRNWISISRTCWAGLFPKQTKRRKVKVREALEILTAEEAGRLIDMEQVVQIALEKVEQEGIIFLDEIDKIAGRESSHGPDISREGVQRDLLPLVEGSTVTTKYGMLKNRPHPVHSGRGLSHQQAQ